MSAAIFAVFHFFLFKFLVTGMLGIILAYVCLRTASILPAIIAHLMHNGLTVLAALYPGWSARLGIEAPDSDGWSHLPLHVILPAAALFLAGLFLVSGSRDAADSSFKVAPADSPSAV